MSIYSEASALRKKFEQLLKERLSTQADTNTKHDSLKSGIQSQEAPAPIATNPTPGTPAGANHFLKVPTEIISQIACELVKFPSRKSYIPKEENKSSRILPRKLNFKSKQSPARISGNHALNFGLTCRRHLEITLPCIYREALIYFPLRGSDHEQIMEGLRKTGVHTRDLGFGIDWDSTTPPSPASIIQCFPNITVLKLVFKPIDACLVLNIIEASLSLCRMLKDLTIAGRVVATSLIYLTETNIIRTAPPVHLEHLKLNLTGAGNQIFLMQLTEILQNSCEQLRTLEYNPFNYLNLYSDDMDGSMFVSPMIWGEVGHSMRSEKLQEIRLRVPAGHTQRFMNFIHMLPAGRRENVKTFALDFRESRKSFCDFEDVIKAEVLLFSNLTHLRFGHVERRDGVTDEMKRREAESMERMFISAATVLPYLQEIIWYEDARGKDSNWTWRREEGKPWNHEKLIKDP